MAFKYINPGYGELFSANQKATTYSNTKNPINGVCVESSPSENIIIPACHEVWIKADFFSTDDDYSMSYGIYVDNSDSNKTGYNCRTLFDHRLYNKGIEQVVSKNEMVLNTNKLNSIVLHIKSSATDGILEVTANEKPLFSYSGNVFNGQSITTISIWSLSLTAVSNIIVSDSDISQQKVLIANIKDLSGNWDGITESLAKAEDVGQKLTSKIDATDLKEKMDAISSKAKLTSVALAATGIRYNVAKVNALTATINNGISDVLSETKKIQSNNTILPVSYTGDLSSDDLKNYTFNLTSAKV